MLGILEFPVIPQPLWGISIWNSRALVIASEAKQSLRILNFYLKFSTMSSSGLTRGSLYGILEFSTSLRGFEKRGSNLHY